MDDPCCDCSCAFEDSSFCGMSYDKPRKRTRCYCSTLSPVRDSGKMVRFRYLSFCRRHRCPLLTVRRPSSSPYGLATVDDAIDGEKQDSQDNWRLCRTRDNGIQCVLSPSSDAAPRRRGLDTPPCKVDKYIVTVATGRSASGIQISHLARSTVDLNSKHDFCLLFRRICPSSLLPCSISLGSSRRPDSFERMSWSRQSPKVVSERRRRKITLFRRISFRVSSVSFSPWSFWRESLRRRCRSCESPAKDFSQSFVRNALSTSRSWIFSQGTLSAWWFGGRYRCRNSFKPKTPRVMEWRRLAIVLRFAWLHSSPAKGVRNQVNSRAASEMLSLSLLSALWWQASNVHECYNYYKPAWQLPVVRTKLRGLWIANCKCHTPIYVSLLSMHFLLSLKHDATC